MSTEMRVEIIEADDDERQTFEVSVSFANYVLLDLSRLALHGAQETDGALTFALHPDTAAALGRSLTAIAEVAAARFQREVDHVR